MEIATISMQRSILTAKQSSIDLTLAMLTAIIIRKLADLMVEIATISIQSILTAKHGIDLTLAIVTAITTLPTIQKLVNMMVEIVFKLILKNIL